MSESHSARDVLRDLIELRTGLGPAIEAVGRLGWDGEEDAVLLTRADARRIVSRYEDGELTASDIEDWANAVEGWEDIGFEAGAEQRLRAFVFEAGNPLLSRPIADSHADWLDGL